MLFKNQPLNRTTRAFPLLHPKRMFNPTIFTKSYCLVFTILFWTSAYSQTADFTFTTSNGAFCVPASVQFNASAPGTPVGYIWDFGNGDLSNSRNTSYTYNAIGSYPVKLTVVYQDSVREVNKTVVVNPTASANVTQDRNYICRPGAINFTASGSAGIISYAWSFGDNTNSTTSTPAVMHNYAAMGNYTTNVTVTDANGCTANAATQIRVAPPDINASISQRDGCVPATVSFNSSVNLPVGGTVASYAWSFGDAAITTTTAATSHIYNATGSYNPSLVITTNEGCTNSYNFGNIAFGIPPTNTVFYFQKDTICASNLLVMIGKADSANRYHWDYGDGNATDISDTITTHKYNSLGNKTVSLTPSYNGCSSAAVSKNAYVTGVIASYTFANSCLQRNTFTFTSTTAGNVSSYRWNLGDNTQMNNVSTFQHSYSLPGSYPSSLIVYDSTTACADTASQTLNYAVPTLTATDTIVCKGGKVTFTINSNFPNANSRYEWDLVGDHFGPIPEDVITDYRPKYHGVFYNQVVIDNGAGYCKDTIKMVQPVRVRGPQIDFSFPGSICTNTPLQVINNHKPYYPADTIRLYYWNMGMSASNDTSYQPAPYLYRNAGTYNITSFAVDKNGCRDSLTKQVQVNAIPFVQAFPKVDTACLGQTKRLLAFHSDSLYWLPAGQLSCANCDTTFVTPGTTSKYIAVAVDANGCMNTDTSLVKVFSPFTASVSFTDTAFCLNDSARLTAFPQDKKIVWQPATALSGTTIYNPVAKPTQTTQYKAVLTDSANCFTDSVGVKVTVIQPPTVDAGPTRVYPFYATFNFEPTYSNNVVSYKWTPNALLNCATCAFPSGRNDFSQTYTVKVVSDSGCVAQDSVRILIECRDSYLLLPTAFTPDNNGLNDYYFPLTRGVSIVKYFAIYNRNGQMMYKAENFAPNNSNFGWDGRYNGNPQPSGAYVYILQALCDEGQVLSRKGSFMIVR